MAVDTPTVLKVRSSHARLGRARILNAALEFVDREGLGALSMRKLGTVLGVEAMALYYYFPSKAALVDAVVGEVLDKLEVPTVGTTADWAAVVRRVASSFRDLGAAHPNVFPLLATVGLDNPASHGPAEAVVAVLSRAGLSSRDAFQAFVALKSYVVGYTLWALGDTFSGPRREVCARAAPPVRAETFPRLAGLAEWLAARSLEAEFQAGLELFIDGIRARLRQER